MTFPKTDPRYWEELLKSGGLAPLDDAKPGKGGMIRQPPIPDPTLTHAEQDAWKTLSEALAANDLTVLSPRDIKQASSPLYARRRQGDAAIAAHISECKPVTQLCKQWKRRKYEKSIYERIDRLRGWVSRMPTVVAPEADALSDEEQRLKDILDLFADAQAGHGSRT